MNEIYIVDGQEYSVGFSKLEQFLQKFPNAVKKGKEQGSTEDPTMGQDITGSQLEDGSSESQKSDGSWFSNTWFGRGVAAASTTGEASDLLLEGSNVNMETIQEFIKAKEGEAREHVPSKRMQKFQKQYEKDGKTWSAFFRGVKKDPALMAELFVQSLGTQIGTFIDAPEARAATATGAGAGAAAGAYLGWGALGTGFAGAMGGLATSMEAALTFGELIEEELKKEGKEFTDVNIKELLEGPKGKSIRNKAIGRGLTIGAVEGLTGGIAGKATTSTVRTVSKMAKEVGKGSKRAKVAGGVAGVGVEAVGGGLGEVGGRLAAGQEMDPAEIGFEAITGTVTAPGNVGLALVQHKKPTYKLNGKEVSYAQMKDFVETADDIDIAKANIKMENDFTGLGQIATKKQNDAIVDSQIDEKITDKEDRKKLVELEADRIKAEADVKKKGIDKVPGAPEKLATIQAKIDAIIGKYEGAVGIGETQAAQDVAKTVRENRISETIAFAETQGQKIGKETIVVDNNEQAQAAYDKIAKEMGLKAKDVTNADGFIVGDSIIINKDIAGRTGAINVGAHEVLHGVLAKHMQSLDTAGKKKLISSFKGVLSKKQLAAVTKRLEENYSDQIAEDPNFMDTTDEWFTAFSDAIEQNEITFDEGVFSKIKNTIQEVLRKFGIKKDFADGRQAYNFLKDYSASIKKNKLSSRALALAGESVTVTDVKKSVSPLEEINKLIPDNVKTQEDYYKLLDDPRVTNRILDTKGKLAPVIEAYIRSRSTSTDIARENIQAVKDRLVNFDPSAKRADGTIVGPEGFGEFIFANARFGKMVAEKKLAIKAAETKRTTRIDDPDVKDIADDTPTPTTEIEDKTKARKLKDFNVELDNGLADALTIEEVNSLLDSYATGKITFKQAKAKMEELVAKDIRSELSKSIPGIAKNKKTGKVEPTPEYESFIRNEYNEVVQSLGIKTIRTAYKKWFKQEKTGKKNYKNIDPVTGKVSNFVKDTQINTTNKREYIRWFLEGKPNDLRERRTALIRRISKRKASLAVDNYIAENSDSIDAKILSFMSTLSDSAENATNEQVSFDSVKFSKTFNKKANNINAQMGRLKKPINGLTHYYKPPNWKEGDKVLTFSYNKKTGKWNKGFVYEQAFAETLQEISNNIEDFVVTLEVVGEEGGRADAQVSYLGEIENHEIKKQLSAFFGSTLINNLNIKNKTFTLANNIHNDIKSRNGKTTLKSFVENTIIPNLKEKVQVINKEIDLYNKKYGYKKGDLEFAEKITGDVVKGPKVATEAIPREVWNKVGKELGVLKTGVEVIQNHYATKEAGKVKSISIFGYGASRIDPTSIFKGLPMLDAATEVYASLRYGKSEKRGSKEFVTFKTGLQFRLDKSVNKGQPNNAPNSGLITEQGILEALGNPPAFSKSISKVKTLNNAVKMSRSAFDKFQLQKQRGKEFVESIRPQLKQSRGITVLDFDDTLATTESLVRFTAPDGTKGVLNAEEYAAQYQYLLEQGYKFDFTEFDKVVKGKIAPLFQKALKLQGKFGPENMFILTARPPAAQKAIFDFLKANGLNIPIKNITGLGNSTSEAKALWIAEKVGEGYNDFYFADDALQNVQAVKNMLDQFDVKSKVQQAKVKFSKSMDKDFNNILENVTGIDAKKRFSETKARKRGADKGKFRFFIPPSHEDFVGLLYNFMGRGKEGNKHRDFFEQALVRPLNRAYREIDTAKQAIANDYKSLNKQFPDVKKKLVKNTPDSDFTFQDAIRVYLWNKHGYTIPGLSKTDQANLVEIVMNDVDLLSYAEAVNTISRQDTYVDPGQNWETGNIRIDLVDATGRVGRAEYFTEFNENVDIIFSPENLNKIEAAYGASFRSALEDMLYRIKTGINRPKGASAKPNMLLNWLNASVSGVMFFNTRSALLQQMSNVNYLNFADNNIYAAGKAFANQPQYWKDFAMIFNSDMLKHRRGGLQTDINGAELAEAIKKARPGNIFDQVAIITGKALRLGFLPTQIGDNIAIATGGATFYRNRVNKYIKDGLSKKEAENKAFTDLQDITNATQQSARPDMTSQQQAAVIGKIVLNFLNTPSQYNRIIKKAASDVINRRITPPNTTQMQSDMSNMSRILYYGAAQNLIFYSLQTALFAVMFGLDDEDEQKKAEQFLKKKERVINGSIDTILRGSGIYGVAVSTVKNMLIKFLEQRKKGYNKDESAVLMEALNFSPVVGIRARSIVNAEKTVNYNEKVIKEMETFDIDNPMWPAVTNYIQVTGLPANRIYQKTINLRNASDNDYEAWQRVLFFSGYTTWSLGLEDTKKMKDIKEKVKEKKKTTPRSRSRSRSRTRTRTR